MCTKFHLRQLHTLIHPHSWVRDGRAWQDVLRAHGQDLGDRLAHEMEDYVTTSADYLQRRGELDHAREQRYHG